MELPLSLIEETVNETEMYFFTKETEKGVPGHIHVCVRKGEKFILFTACTSQTDTIFKFVTRTNADPNTFPCFAPDNINCFKQLTYINCNNIIEFDRTEFLNQIKENKVYKLQGIITDDAMQQIVKGIKLSKTIPENIKKLF